MKIKEINVSKSGVIPNASYSNLKPAYSITVELENGENEEEAIMKCKAIVNRHFELDEYSARVDLIQKQFKTLRFYPTPEGVKYPSATSVLYYDKDFFKSKGELLQYGSMGTIIHTVFWFALKSYQSDIAKGKKDIKIIWKDPTEFPELEKHVGIVKEGSLQLKWENYSYQIFGNIFIPKIKKVYAIEKTVLNPEIRVGGTLDLVADLELTKGNVKLSIVDLKTGTYDFMQHAFYGKTWEKINNKKIEQMVTFPLGKTDNKQGYKSPIVETDINKYWDMMLVKREEFRDTFEI
jgi:hypothetical protein